MRGLKNLFVDTILFFVDLQNISRSKINQNLMRFDTINGNDLLQSCIQDFEGLSIALYRYQYQHNKLYKAYNDALRINPNSVKKTLQIPFLPISFFKTHKVVSDLALPTSMVFESSGTTGMIPSRHYVLDANLYNDLALAGFESFYNNIEDWVVLALLPSYLERNNSSLVFMAQMLMDKSVHPDNGFYLNEFDVLQKKLLKLKSEGKKILLLGVTFALLDFATNYPMDLNGVVVMETGGMKGRQAEWTRSQVHDYLKKAWNLNEIHSEYGMTELLSQAYATKDGIFQGIPAMRTFIRDIQDPLETVAVGMGGLNIVDLANVHSCSFIATEDVGKVNADGSFEVLGRMDFATLRGCSLLAV
jgi:hypothetical protein